MGNILVDQNHTIATVDSADFDSVQLGIKPIEVFGHLQMKKWYNEIKIISLITWKRMIMYVALKEKLKYTDFNWEKRIKNFHFFHKIISEN